MRSKIVGVFVKTERGFVIRILDLRVPEHRYYFEHLDCCFREEAEIIAARTSIARMRHHLHNGGRYRVRSLWLEPYIPSGIVDPPTMNRRRAMWVDGDRPPTHEWELALEIIEPLDWRSRLERWLAKKFLRPMRTVRVSDETLIDATDFSRRLMMRAAIDIERSLNDPDGPRL